MTPLADLRRAVLDLDNVPAGTPVVLQASYGERPSLSWDQANGVVRLNIGGGQPQGRPTMGQLRAWLSLPPEGRAGDLRGFWDSARLREPSTWRGIATFASAAVSGFHGVKRNGGSVFWGVWWFAWGAALPGLAPLVAVAQGYGDCANNCRRAPTEKR